MSPLAGFALWGPLALLTAAAMEPWAALLHGRLWHRALWPVHVTHHRPRPTAPQLELNDLLSLLHAPLAVALILFGCQGPAGVGRQVAFGVGVGMSAFGLAYVLVHDGLVHGRLPVAKLLRVPYLRRVRAAHLRHHAHAGPPFGLFLGPWSRPLDPTVGAGRAAVGGSAGPLPRGVDGAPSAPQS